MADNAMQIKNISGKVGSYAISTINFDTWFSEPATQIPQRTKKSRGVKEIINKIFIECINVIEDQFWIEKFNAAAIGKFPQKFGFHDGVLTYKKGAKSQSLEVSDNPLEAAYACMEFFRVNGGIFSPTDEQNTIDEQNNNSNMAPTLPLTWADANKKMQECIISYYITDMKALMTLNDKEAENLRQTIKLGISNKFFGKHNIRIESNRIHSITGLLWNDQKRAFYIDPTLKPNVTRSYTRNKKGTISVDPSQKDTVPQFELKWRKYIETMEKKLIRDAKRMRRITIKDYSESVPSTPISTTPRSDPMSTGNEEDDYDE